MALGDSPPKCHFLEKKWSLMENVAHTFQNIPSMGDLEVGGSAVHGGATSSSYKCCCYYYVITLPLRSCFFISLADPSLVLVLYRSQQTYSPTLVFKKRHILIAI